MPIYTYTTIDDPLASATSGNGTDALGINAAGQIVGNYGDGSNVHGFLLTNGLYATLDDPSGPHGTYASGINGNGQIVGYYYDGTFGVHGFLYSNGTYTTLDDPLGANGT